MNHQDHVSLLQNANILSGTTWADLGSGEGAFTLALRDIAGSESSIFSVDKNKSSLQIQKEVFREHFPKSKITYVHQNFTEALKLPKLDGILMANSLHFIKNKIPLLKQLLTYLKKDGMFILVEYNVDAGNMWVPYPISYTSFKKLAAEVGLAEPEFLHNIPSTFLKEIYAAKSVKI